MVVMSVAFSYCVTDRCAEENVIHNCFPVTVEKCITWPFSNARRRCDDKVAVAYGFKKEITLLVSGSTEVSIKVTNENHWAIQLKGADD